MSRKISKGFAAILPVALALAAAPVAAQTTYRACRVPSVGAIYMIRVSNAPSACLDATHVEFQWTEGGSTTIPDSSITTLKLADNAVTSAKIADGSVVAADIATDGVGAAEIAAGAVGSSEVLDNSLTANDLGDDSVGGAELGLEVVSVDRNGVTTGSSAATVFCPAGKRVISGGYLLTASTGGSSFDFNVILSYPATTTSWSMTAVHPTATSFSWRGYAVCVIQ